MADLLLQHVGHAIRRRPHALADLSAPGEPARQADAHIAILVRLDPVGVPHLGLAHHGAGFHRRVDLVARAVEKAGVDEDDAVPHLIDAGGEIGRRAPLLIHQAELDGVAFQAEHVLDRIEQPVGEARLGRPVHLGLHDVDRAGAAVAETAETLEVVHARSGW